ncbi:hypothetical protein N7G274_009946 [Stereocaulon virgatum]|uniref:C2H2-type domain-containing protein n=1 Tax=Stereocaulon virgatum TaxID=373712 RepID=A0ABR3ZUI7_9LECA
MPSQGRKKGHPSRSYHYCRLDDEGKDGDYSDSYKASKEYAVARYEPSKLAKYDNGYDNGYNNGHNIPKADRLDTYNNPDGHHFDGNYDSGPPPNVYQMHAQNLFVLAPGAKVVMGGDETPDPEHIKETHQSWRRDRTIITQQSSADYASGSKKQKSSRHKSSYSGSGKHRHESDFYDCPKHDCDWEGEKDDIRALLRHLRNVHGEHIGCF